MAFLLILFISFIAINCSDTSHDNRDLDKRKSLLDRLSQLLPIPSFNTQDLFDDLLSIVGSTVKGVLKASLPTFIYESFSNIYTDHFKSTDSIIREMDKRLIAMEKDLKADVKNRQTKLDYLKDQLADLKSQLADMKTQLNKIETVVSEIRDNNNLWSLIYQALIMMVYFFIGIITILILCITSILWI